MKGVIFLNNDMRILRGNNAVYDVEFTFDGEAGVLSDGDMIIFTVKKSHDRNSDVIMQKIIDYDDFVNEEKVQIKFIPEDTLSLETGTYFYDCALQTADGCFYTFIRASFTVIDVLGERIGE